MELCEVAQVGVGRLKKIADENAQPLGAQSLNFCTAK